MDECALRCAWWHRTLVHSFGGAFSITVHVRAVVLVEHCALRSANYWFWFYLGCAERLCRGNGIVVGYFIAVMNGVVLTVVTVVMVNITLFNKPLLCRSVVAFALQRLHSRVSNGRGVYRYRAAAMIVLYSSLRVLIVIRCY
ncbi:hypothetical protein AVEN_243944-1 [Araneus ventricosus]|uniref:Uncharacterized protein n=1 Tax=Araneus ventricosus TaxID=182803 RepID=A0A4Y2QMD0_ARAVE|nr:hypothetical protein AVEN_243944-1 [Araneus ventricosus]